MGDLRKCFGLKTSRGRRVLGLRVRRQAENARTKLGRRRWRLLPFQIENHSCNLKISTLLIVQMGQSKEQKRKAADRV